MFRHVLRGDAIDRYLKIVRFIEMHFDYKNIDHFKMFLQSSYTNIGSAVKLLRYLCHNLPSLHECTVCFFNWLKTIKTDQSTALGALDCRKNTETEFNKIASY